MKYLLLIPVIFISLYSSGEEGRLNRESNDYKYTSLGVHVTKAEDSGFAINLSVALPGSFPLRRFAFLLHSPGPARNLCLP